MLIIDGDGLYVYEENTKTPTESDHPVYQARIELALGQNQWLYAPSEGHDLAKYNTAKQSPAKVDEFQKDLAFYLKKYGPRVTDLLLARGAVSLTLSIDKSVLTQVTNG